jgi:cytochrome c oxidase subunit 2
MMLAWFRRSFALPPGASTFADGIDGLHLFFLATTLLGALLIALAVAYFVARYQSSDPARATPEVSASGGREALIIGACLSLFLLWWVIGYRQYVRMRHPPPGAAVVYVTAKQWMWKFSYPSGNSSLDVLTVPVARPTQLIMTSRDVIHSFFVPAFRVKQDVLPGRYVSVWFEPTQVGEYLLECAEYCGVSHSRMLGRVRVLSVEDYAAWLEGTTDSRDSSMNLVSLGRDAAVRHACFSCHTVDGQAHIGPTWQGLFGASVELTSGARVTADAAYLTRAMMDPAAEVVAGYPPVMPTYLGSLSQPEVAAILEYLRSLSAASVPPSVRLPRVEVVSRSTAAQGASSP